jgi:hypothetical protein
VIRTDSLPASRAAAQHLAELHLRRARNLNGGWAIRRITDGLVGVGYVVLALSLEGPAGSPAEK